MHHPIRPYVQTYTSLCRQIHKPIQTYADRCIDLYRPFADLCIDLYRPMHTYAGSYARDASVLPLASDRANMLHVVKEGGPDLVIGCLLHAIHAPQAIKLHQVDPARVGRPWRRGAYIQTL